jgi:hypothetical protein
MDLLTTILACSLYPHDDALVRAITEGPGAGNPYLVEGDSPDPEPPTTREQAILRARGLIDRGVRPLLGLMVLPPSWLAAFGQPTESAFDPCVNIAIGSAKMSEFDADCRKGAPPLEPQALAQVNRRACVLRKYEAETGALDFEMTVLLELSAQKPSEPEILATPILPLQTPRVWGPDRILVPVALP